jgi:cytochrome b6-f complex iron-sulfur subunit
MADKKKMSVADMIAAARKADGGDAPEPEPSGADQSAAAEASAPETESPAKPAAKPAGKPGERPSVAEMLAMARAGKKGEAEKPAAKEKPVAKPAAKAKPAAATAKAKPSAPAGPKDTASILAAARQGSKPGPKPKADAGSPEAAGAVSKAKPIVPPMPAKPAYAVPSKSEPKVDKGRRLAVMSMAMGSALALGFTSLAATGALWTLGLARFMFPNILREPPSQFKVGFPGDFSYGMVETKFKAQFGVWIVNYEYQGEPQIYALQSICTHLGCTPNWLEAEQKFKCPCHGSGFYKDGINFEGPAPRPLERYAISTADDGQLLVDKSRSFQEEMGGWADPASYVSV